MTEIKDLLLKILEESPDIAIWVLVIIYGYKVAIAGTVYGVIRFAIKTICETVKRPRELKLGDKCLGESTANNLEAFLDSVTSTSYLHNSDVEELKQAWEAGRSSRERARYANEENVSPSRESFDMAVSKDMNTDSPQKYGVEVPEEITEAAIKLHNWFLSNGFGDEWQFMGVCSRSFANRLDAMTDSDGQSDAIRMDWLERNFSSIQRNRHPDMSGKQIHLASDRSRFRGHSIRECVDEAMGG